MLDYKKVWAHVRASGAVTPSMIVEFCILKAIYASKGNAKKAEKLLTMYLSKAFTPITRKNLLENGKHDYTALQKAIEDVSEQTVLGVPAKALEQYELLYKNLVNLLSHNTVREYSKRRYVYIFVRQDLFKEYQLVQAAHVAYAAGWQIALDNSAETIDPHNVYFTVVGVPHLKDLQRVMAELLDLDITHTLFREPDIGDEPTAVATYPIKVNERGQLLRYKLLSFTLGELDPKIDQAA